MSAEPLVRIAFLADHPEHLSSVAAWVHQEWEQYRPGASLDATAGRFRTHLQRDAIPLTLIALREGALVGTASIFTIDMTTRADLGPWLAAVYVPREQRNRGTGSQLVRAIEAVAQRLHVARLYLFTPDREHFYARLGWTRVEAAAYDNHAVVIMTKWLAANAGSGGGD